MEGMEGREKIFTLEKMFWFWVYLLLHVGFFTCVYSGSLLYKHFYLGKQAVLLGEVEAFEEIPEQRR